MVLWGTTSPPAHNRQHLRRHEPGHVLLRAVQQGEVVEQLMQGDRGAGAKITVVALLDAQKKTGKTDILIILHSRLIHTAHCP